MAAPERRHQLYGQEPKSWITGIIGRYQTMGEQQPGVCLPNRKESQ
jgi:hypothetical protein